MRLPTRLTVALVLTAAWTLPVSAGDRALTFTDLMKMRQIRQVEISRQRRRTNGAA